MIIAVSGLPRSGTSMMMQMLEAGGLPVVSDNVRKPDEDNLRGYYELTAIKKLNEDSSCLDDADGKVVKVISMLLYDLPIDRSYKVVFMNRPMSEILASQATMLKRRGEDAGPPDEAMAAHYETHVRKLKEWLAEQGNIEVLFCGYHDVLADPERHANEIERFVEVELDKGAMVRAVDPSLHRQRG